MLNHLFIEKLGWKGFESGVYGDPPSINFWFRQAATYMTCLLIMKLLVVGLFVLVPGVFTLGQWLLSWTHVGGEVLQVALYVPKDPDCSKFANWHSVLWESSPLP